MDSLLFQKHSIKFSIFFTTGSTCWHLVQPVHRVSRCKTLIFGNYFIISPFFELGIVYRFFSWIPYSSRNIISNFQDFLQPVRLVDIRFSRFIESTGVKHWFWSFWDPNPTWLRPISSRSVLGNVVGPFWALVWVSCSPPWIHMDSWWWSKLKTEGSELAS